MWRWTGAPLRAPRPALRWSGAKETGPHPQPPSTVPQAEEGAFVLTGNSAAGRLRHPGQPLRQRRPDGLVAASAVVAVRGKQRVHARIVRLAGQVAGHVDGRDLFGGEPVQERLVLLRIAVAYGDHL